jgi:hypothetical protein
VRRRWGAWDCEEMIKPTVAAEFIISRVTCTRTDLSLADSWFLLLTLVTFYGKLKCCVCEFIEWYNCVESSNFKPALCEFFSL